VLGGVLIPIIFNHDNCTIAKNIKYMKRNPDRSASEVNGMFRINDMIDLPIIQDKSAQRICTVRDVIVDMREIRIYALVCREKLLRRFLEAVPFENVEEITQSSIIITGRICRIDLRQLEMKSRRFQSYGNILGKLVLNPRGGHWNNKGPACGYKQRDY